MVASAALPARVTSSSTPMAVLDMVISGQVQAVVPR
jgi:hypothetical protein